MIALGRRSARRMPRMPAKGTGPISVLPIAAIAWSAIMLGLLAAAAMDFKKRIIPNAYVMLIAVAGAALRLAADGASAWISAIAAIAVFLTLKVLADRSIIGGGDAKLIAAVTLLVPADRVASLILCVVLAGGLVSCCYLIARALLSTDALRRAVVSDVPKAMGRRLLHAEASKIIAGEPMPYALAVLGGVVVYGIMELM